MAIFFNFFFSAGSGTGFWVGRQLGKKKLGFFIATVGAKNRVGRDMGNTHNNTGALTGVTCIVQVLYLARCWHN